MGGSDADGGPLGGRVRPQAAGEARERAAGVAVHPYALRVRLPVPAGAFTAFSQDGDDSVTGCGPVAASLAPLRPRRRKGPMIIKRLVLVLALVASLAFVVAACG